MASTNPASLRVLEKSGFSREAVFSEQFFDGRKLHDSFAYKKFRPFAHFTEREFGSMEMNVSDRTRSMPRAFAIIPARGGSTRIPLKNIRMMAGKPILEHAASAAIKSCVFGEIHVSTESPEVAEVAKGLKVPPRFQRPERLGHNSVSIREVVQYTVKRYESLGFSYEHVAVISATACLLSPDVIRQSYERFLEDPSVPLLSVVANQPPPEKAFVQVGDVLQPLNPESFRRHTQDYTQSFSDAGAMAWFEAGYVSSPAFQDGSQYRPFLLPRWMGIDIDTEDDWMLAEYVMLGRELEHKTAR